MTSKDAPRGTVKFVADPGLMELTKLVTIRRAHFPRHEVILFSLKRERYCIFLVVGRADPLDQRVFSGLRQRDVVLFS